MDSMKGVDILNDNYFYKNQLIPSPNDFEFKQDDNPFLWKELMQININYIKKSKDISPIEPYVDNILLSSLTSNDITTLPEEYILQLVNLLQLIGQYLAYTQNKLQFDNETLKKNLFQFNKNLNDNERFQKIIKNLTRQNQEKDILIKTYQNIVKSGNINYVNNDLIEDHKNDNNNEIFEKKNYCCRFCSGKKFKTKQYLEQHLKRRHLIEAALDENEENNDINYKMKSRKNNFDQKLDSLRAYLENIIKQNQMNNDYYKLNQKLDFLQNSLISQNLNASNYSQNIGYFTATQPQNIHNQTSTNITKNILVEKTIKENINTEKSISNTNNLDGLNQLKLQMSQKLEKNKKEYDDKIIEFSKEFKLYKDRIEKELLALKTSSLDKPISFHKNTDTINSYNPQDSSKKYSKETTNININKSQNMNINNLENKNTNQKNLQSPNIDDKKNNKNNLNNNNVITNENVKETIKNEENIKIDDKNPDIKIDSLNIPSISEDTGIYNKSNEFKSPKFSKTKSMIYSPLSDNDVLSALEIFKKKFEDRDYCYNRLTDNYMIKTTPSSFIANNVENNIIKKENDLLPKDFENLNNQQLNILINDLVDKNEKNLFHGGKCYAYYGNDINKALDLDSIISDYKILNNELTKIKKNKKPTIISTDTFIKNNNVNIDTTSNSKHDNVSNNYFEINTNIKNNNILNKDYKISDVSDINQYNF